jgi:hypothetical protein
MKGNIVRTNGKRVVQSIIKVPSELIKLDRDVELAVDIFFVNKKHIFFTTYSTKICFSKVTHLMTCEIKAIWGVPAVIVIECFKFLGRCEPAILTFNNWQDRDIGDSNPQDSDPEGISDEDSVIIYPAVEIPGVDETMNPAEIAGVDPDFIV